MKFKIDTGAKKLLKILHKNSFDAYVVGGCVRDTLLEIVPKDWDICTNARPQEVKTILNNNSIKCFETGIKHGTVTAVYNNKNYDITTFRSEGNYSDNRHPDSVEFEPTIDLDLSRRDFTINALAYNKKAGLIDLFEGKKCLENKIIKCVGVPRARFEEDALRIIRALRFSATLGFKIEKETHSAILECAPLLKNISAERLRDEFLKLICGNYAAPILLNYTQVLKYIIPEIEKMSGFNQQCKYHDMDVWQHSVKTCMCVKPKPIIRFAALFHDIGKPFCFRIDEKGVGHFPGHAKIGEQKVKNTCESLHTSKNFKNKVAELVKYHDRDIRFSQKSLRKLILKIGKKQTKNLVIIRFADTFAHSTYKLSENLTYWSKELQLYQKTVNSMQVFKINELKIDGNDIIKLGIEPGPKVGQILNKLFEEVVNNTLKNKRKTLKKRAKYLVNFNN
ncbi:MAG: CCA tRNA nucleotidyltransferase [Coriobacteriales bacterium]|nr:CCA tRNA nucleotidyltransferase [Coriobacteriales bacterium]